MGFGCVNRPYAPFSQQGGLGRVHQLFGKQLPQVMDELNRELVA